MRFLCVYKSGQPETNTPPSPAEMQAMGQLIGEMSKAGVLLGTEGCLPSACGARVRADGGDFRVTDGPFPEQAHRIGGFCLLQVKTKAEAIEWSKRFLSLVRVGESDLYQLHDTPAA